MSFFGRQSIVLLAISLGFAADAAAGIVATVNSTGNSSDASPGNGVCATSGGSCTLRAAIQETNARSDLDTIRFAIGSGVQRISTGSSQLPTVTSPVIIDGWTQPGFAGTPLIEIRGGSGDGLRISAGGSTVRGLVINGFSGRGVVLTGGGNNVLEGNYIGLDVTGADAVHNGASGVYIDGSQNNRIGGTIIQQRNVISGNMTEYTPGGNLGGIEIHNGGGNVIQGNFIGTDVTGMLDRGNIGRGISFVGSTNNVVGGPEPGAANLISGNFSTGVRMRDGSHGTLVQGNWIGVNRTLTAPLSNDRGVQMRGASHNNQVIANIIAGQVYNGILIQEESNDNYVLGNLVFYNGFGTRDDLCSVCENQEDYSGVQVYEGERNYVLANRIWANKFLGLAVGQRSPKPDRPTIISATVAGGVTTITGQAEGPAGVDYLIDLFANPACDLPFEGIDHQTGEGQFYLGQTQATVAANGLATFNAAIAWSTPAGWVITATATREGLNTSMFSSCKPVQ